MGSGMGMPSIGIYSYELYKFYDVENIIRIGSAGAYTDKLDLFDLVLADGAWSESTFAKAQADVDGDVMYPSEDLNKKIIEYRLRGIIMNANERIQQVKRHYPYDPKKTFITAMVLIT